MRRVFRDNELQRQFETSGYAVVTFLAPDDIKVLENIYYSHKVAEQPGLEISIWNLDYDLSKKISDLSGALIAARLTDVLADYAPLYSGFVTKIPGKPNAALLHQDPTFTDETKQRSVTVWAPLVQVNEHNGALHVVSGSHRMFPGYRGYTVFEYDFSGIRDEVASRFSERLETLPGQAVIYDTAALHFSHENTTDAIRIASTTLMIPAETKPIHYHHNRKLNTLDVHEIDNRFLLNYFIKHIQAEELDMPLLGRQPFTPSRQVGIEEFEEKFREANREFSSSII